MMPFQITQAPDGRGLVDLDRDHPFSSPLHAKHAIEVSQAFTPLALAVAFGQAVQQKDAR